jgi:hypothetical protein
MTVNKTYPITPEASEMYSTMCRLRIFGHVKEMKYENDELWCVMHDPKMDLKCRLRMVEGTVTLVKDDE